MNPVAQIVSSNELSGTQALVLYALAFEGDAAIGQLLSATGIANKRTLRKALNDLIGLDLVEQKGSKIAAKWQQNCPQTDLLNRAPYSILMDGGVSKDTTPLNSGGEWCR